MDPQAKRIAAARRNHDGVLLTYKDAQVAAAAGDFVPRTLLDDALRRASLAEAEARDLGAENGKLRRQVAELQRVYRRQIPCPRGCGRMMNGTNPNRTCCRQCWEADAKQGKRTRWDAAKRRAEAQVKGENPPAVSATELADLTATVDAAPF